MNGINLGDYVTAKNDSYEGDFKFWSKGEKAIVTGFTLNSAQIHIIVELPDSGYMEQFSPSEFLNNWEPVGSSITIH